MQSIYSKSLTFCYELASGLSVAAFYLFSKFSIQKIRYILRIYSLFYTIIKQYYRTVQVGIAPKMTRALKIAMQKKQPISILRDKKYLY